MGHRPVTSHVLILLVAVYLSAVCNQSFFAGVLKAYAPITAHNAFALVSLVLVLVAVNAILLGLVCIGRRGTRLVLSLVLLFAALAAYFMDSFGVVISDEMLQNVAQTNTGEALDLLNYKLLAYLVGLGAIPAFVLTRMNLTWRGWRIELLARLKLLAALLVVMVGLVLLFGGFFASFAREHKALRS